MGQYNHPYFAYRAGRYFKTEVKQKIIVVFQIFQKIFSLVWDYQDQRFLRILRYTEC